MMNGSSRLAWALLFVALLIPSWATAQNEKPKPGDDPVKVQVPNPPLDEGRPLGDVGDRMGTVANQLKSKKADQEVVSRQQHVVGHLDDLVERLRAKRKKAEGG